MEPTVHLLLGWLQRFNPQSPHRSIHDKLLLELRDFKKLRTESLGKCLEGSMH